MPFGRGKPTRAGEGSKAAFDWATFENRPFLFVHIPKTAGSSLRHAIAVSQLCLFIIIITRRAGVVHPATGGSDANAELH